MKVCIVGGGCSALSAALLLQGVARVTLVRPRLPLGTGFATGLWNRAQDAVAAEDLSFTHVRSSAYLSQEGNVLAMPPILSNDTREGPSLGFCRNRDVILSLERRLTQCQIIDGVFGPHLDLDHDLLVFADGANGTASGHHHELYSLGYSVYRGISTRVDSLHPKSFQTWGSFGARFACIPLSKSEVQWYATVPHRYLKLRDHNLQAAGACDSSVSFSSVHSDCGRNNTVVEAPFQNGGRATTVDELLDAFNNFHNPVLQLITSTSSSVFVHDAVTSRPTQVRHRKDRIVHIGDAFQVLDPLLAVGATVGIEEALLLRDVITKTISWSQFHGLRLRRRRQLFHLSRVVNWVSQLHQGAPLRDNLLGAIPHTLKTLLLQQFIQVVAQKQFRRNG